MSASAREKRIEPADGPSLHVVLIAPPWLPVPPPAYGGTEAVVHGIAVGLQRLGAQVTLVAHPESTCPVPRASAGPPTAACLGDRHSEVRFAEAAYRIVDELDADVVHDHTLVGPIIAQQRGVTERCQVVTTSHGPFDEESERHFRAVSPTVPVIAISYDQASTARTVRPATVIHHGLETSAYPMGSGAGGYALCLARMSPTKGIDAAIEVARRAGVPLRIAAKLREPAEQEYFDEVVRPLLGGDVEYVGEVCHDEKVQLLRDAVALVNPIRWPEPFGLAMVEALACGTPVLATRRGAAPEIVEDGLVGRICGDEEEMARALLEVTSIDRRACRRHVEQRFSTERMARDHLAFFRRKLLERVPVLVDPSPTELLERPTLSVERDGPATVSGSGTFDLTASREALAP